MPLGPRTYHLLIKILGLMVFRLAGLIQILDLMSLASLNTLNPKILIRRWYILGPKGT